MNRYPWWKYALVGLVLVIGILYTLPNFFGDSPAVQITSANSFTKVEESTLQTAESLLKAQGIEPLSGGLHQSAGGSGDIYFRFHNVDEQHQAKDVLARGLNPKEQNYTISLNLVPATPSWLSALNAKPMYLGLDLRGGVYFLMQVDMESALKTRMSSLLTEVTGALRSIKVPVRGSQSVVKAVQSPQPVVQLILNFDSEGQQQQARDLLGRRFPNLLVSATQAGGQPQLVLSMSPQEVLHIKDSALNQNIQTLHNRINALGVAEPVIQKQGSTRIVVELPGIQDVAKAKDILGKTATLQVRMVSDIAGVGVPFQNLEGGTLLLSPNVLLTGENIENASAGHDQNNLPSVDLTLDSKGARIFRDVTRDNINKRMAIVLFENGIGKVVTAPVIRSEIPNGRVQITGRFTEQEAAETALLLRAGSLAAPMKIIEERTVGPQLGKENIQKGFNSTLYGFIGIAIFMVLYYHLFGVFSTLGLLFNLVLLLAILSLLQATLTLPGMAAIALTLGMAIDANVLINERIREELRLGLSPQQAITLGFDRAWATIMDSNLTSMVVGIALLAFGSGPIRGFAVVHVLGLLTSMFSAVVGVRAVVNLWYGRRRKLKHISIGTVWRAEASAAGAGGAGGAAGGAYPLPLPEGAELEETEVSDAASAKASGTTSGTASSRSSSKPRVGRGRKKKA